MNGRIALSPQKNIPNIQKDINPQIIPTNIKPLMNPQPNILPNINRFANRSRSP
jgi:hypothetical protein